MTRVWPVARILGLVVATTLAGCGGEWIRLGDATAGGAGASVGGSAGMGNDETGAASGSGGVGGAGGTGMAGAAGCAHRVVSADEVLWIGDSWILIPAAQGGRGIQQNRVRDRAREALAIEIDEDYVSRAASATTMEEIASQYDARQGMTNVKVILMDGGTWDPIEAEMSGASVPDAVETSIGAFQDFLAKVALDGTVEHIVYFLVPALPAIIARDELGPELKRACAMSVVPCHFLDLQRLWEGNDDYTGASGIQASETGAVRIGDAIWEIMQQNCIAQ